MLEEILGAKREKLRVFQVLLLHNDASEEVEVQEAGEVDFLRIQDHLKQGGSVFITSRNSQKLPVPKRRDKDYRHRKNLKHLTTSYFNHV